MSKHTISHAPVILAGDGNALNLADSFFGMSDELGNTLRGIRLGVLVHEFIQGGGSDNAMHCASQTPAAGTADQDLLINGTNAVDGVSRNLFCGRVSITSAGADNLRTFTVLGDDANGRPMAEEIAGPNTTTLEGIKHFTKIRRVIVDADTAGAIQVGQLETGPRGLRRKNVDPLQTFLPKSLAHVAWEGSTLVITGSFDGGNDTAQTATNADQRADYQPVSFTQDMEVIYLADLSKEGMGVNYTDSRQDTFSAI